MCAVLPPHLPDIDELEVGLVDQRGGLQGVSDALMAHLTPRDATKFRMHHRNEALEGYSSPFPHARSRLVT